MEKGSCHFTNSGGSWFSFPAPEEEDDSEGDNNNGLLTRHATILRKNEMHLFGHCPAHDNFWLVACKECGKTVKMSLFTKHCERFHSNLLSSLPSHKPTLDVKRSKNMKVMQPKVVINKLSALKGECMDVDTIDVKIEEAPILPKATTPEPPALAAGNVLTNHAIKKSSNVKKAGKDGPRKFPLTKDREYDPNRHCGVWVEDMQKNCTRSLTCKTHALSLRRAVPGRIKEFDILLLEHRERVNLAKEQQQLLCKTQGSSSGSGNKMSDQRNGLATQVFSGGGQLNKDVASSLAFKSQHSNLNDDQPDMHYLNSHPKPIACCKFGARRAGPGCFVFNRRTDRLRTTVSSMVERLLHPSQSRKIWQSDPYRRAYKACHMKFCHRKFARLQAVGKHSVHRRYNIKTAGQSSNQGTSTRTETSTRTRTATSGAVPTTSTVFRNSNKQKTSRLAERTSQTNRTLKPTLNSAVQSIQTSQQSLSNVKGPIMKESTGVPTSSIRSSAEPDTCDMVTTTELESSVNLGKDSDPATVSVILNGPIGGGDILTNHVQASSGKSYSQSPSPRGSYVIPASPSSPAPGAYKVVNQSDISSGSCQVMSSATVYQRQSSTGSQQLSPLVNGTAPSPPAGSTVIGYQSNFAPSSPRMQAGKGMSLNAGHSISNFSQGQTVVFANTNISQLQGQPISQALTTQLNQDKTQHAQNNLFQKPLASPGRTSCQPPSPQIPSPGRHSPQRSPGNGSRQQQQQQQQQQHSLYLNHQHVPVSTQAPIAQLKQQVENQGQQLQQIKYQQLQQQQPHSLPRSENQQQTHKAQQQTPQYRAQQRIAPAPVQPAQQTYLLQQSQTNHSLSLRQGSGQVVKTSNTVFITNDNLPREIQFSLSRNTHAANTVG